jgi:hypothetical protein
MSHRVTVQTEIKDKALAIEALKAAGVSYREQGNTLQLTGGNYNNAVINLATGQITGDTDWGHDAGKLGLLRQNYTEAKFRAEAFRTGVSITDRVVDKDGNIVLSCRMA